jgi:hypothetical protein
VQEAGVGDPAPLVNDLTVQKGDLPGRTTEGQQADLEPDP